MANIPCSREVFKGRIYLSQYFKDLMVFTMITNRQIFFGLGVNSSYSKGESGIRMTSMSWSSQYRRVKDGMAARDARGALYRQ